MPSCSNRCATRAADASALGRAVVDPLLGALRGELEGGGDAGAAELGAGVVEDGDEGVGVVFVGDDVEVDAAACAVGGGGGEGAVEGGAALRGVAGEDLVGAFDEGRERGGVEGLRA